MKTKVLYLDHAGKLGGAEYQLGRLARSIDRTRIEPLVVFAEDGPAPQLLHQTGVETHVIPLDVKVRQVRKDSLKALGILNPHRITGLFLYSSRLAKFAKDQGVHVIHTNSLKAHIYGGIAGRMAGLPVIWHIRDFIDETYLPRAAVMMIRLLARFVPSYVVAVSQSVLDKLHLAPRQASVTDNQKTAVVHDGLCEEELDAAKEDESRTWPETVRIGIVGRLTSWKGQHIFLKAAAKLIKAGHKASFVIVGAPLFGEEDYERELREMVHPLGIAGHVEFLGFRSDVPEVLRNLDILVHASTSADPCPNTVLEGMAAGLPVVGTNGGGVPELIADGETGLLVPMGDADGLASALETLLADPARAQRMGLAGGVRVRRYFTADRMARQVEGVYQKIVNRVKAPAYRPIEASLPVDARALERVR